MYPQTWRPSASANTLHSGNVCGRTGSALLVAARQIAKANTSDRIECLLVLGLDQAARGLELGERGLGLAHSDHRVGGISACSGDAGGDALVLELDASLGLLLDEPRKAAPGLIEKTAENLKEIVFSLRVKQRQRSLRRRPQLWTKKSLQKLKFSGILLRTTLSLFRKSLFKETLEKVVMALVACLLHF